MGTTRQIPPAEWKEYFDRFTRQFLGEDATEAATIEVMSPTLGDQFEVTAARLLGLGYDPKSRAFEVSLDDMDHLVFRPGEILGRRGPTGVHLRPRAGARGRQPGDHLHPTQRAPRHRERGAVTGAG